MPCRPKLNKKLFHLLTFDTKWGNVSHNWHSLGVFTWSMIHPQGSYFGLELQCFNLPSVNIASDNVDDVCIHTFIIKKYLPWFHLSWSCLLIKLKYILISLVEYKLYRCIQIDCISLSRRKANRHIIQYIYISMPWKVHNFHGCLIVVQYHIIVRILAMIPGEHSSLVIPLDNKQLVSKL